MAENMEKMVNMDDQGRIVLPARIRKVMGMRGRRKFLIRLEGSKIILELFPEDLSKSVEDWTELARSVKAEAFSETLEESWKWISLEYAGRKLGLS